MKGPLADSLEPVAVKATDKTMASLPRDGTILASDMAMLSVAISLKRIADVLESGDLPPSLHASISNLAWEAGRSFERGRRTST